MIAFLRIDFTSTGELDCVAAVMIAFLRIDFTTAGELDCVAAVKRHPVLHFSVDFIILPFGIMNSIVEL